MVNSRTSFGHPVNNIPIVRKIENKSMKPSISLWHVGTDGDCPHSSNETELSHRWRERARQTLGTVS
jgi:hypothetical protein